MTEVKTLSRLVRVYNAVYKIHNFRPNKISHFILTKIYEQIQNMYKKYTGLEQVFEAITKNREAIRKMYEPIILITMNRTQARAYVERLLKERNNANNLYRREYEMLIHKSLYEFMRLGFTFLVAKTPDEWKLMK